MRIITIIWLVFVSAFLYAGKPITIKTERKDVQEVAVRKGLPNFFEKAKRGDSIKVAYLGGSITAQPGWRVYSLEWFSELYPQASFFEINAAIGGTGSDFGAFRLHDQVVSFNPDLVFVEFAVNDSKKPEMRTMRSIESIVRKIWENNPATDICFVYTIMANYIDTEMEGNLPIAAQRMEKIAGHYGIPSVNFGYEVCRLLTNNQLIFTGEEKVIDGVQVFSRDGVHPYVETGHKAYLTSIKRSFEEMRKAKKVARKSKMPEPLTPNYFLNPQMLDFSEAKLSPGWETIPTRDHPDFSKFSKQLSKIGEAKPGETLSFRFKGAAFGIYDIMGPSAGKVLLEVDGNPKDTIYRFDAYCTYYRMNYILIDDLEDKEHEVTFKVLDGPIDKAAILAKREKVIVNAGDYKDNNWYIGKLLVDGFLMP